MSSGVHPGVDLPRTGGVNVGRKTDVLPIALAQALAVVTYVGGVPTLQTAHNVASISDVGAGILDIFWERPFVDANYCPICCTFQTSVPGASNRVAYFRFVNPGNVRVFVQNSTGPTQDVDAIYVVAFGRIA